MQAALAATTLKKASPLKAAVVDPAASEAAQRAFYAALKDSLKRAASQMRICITTDAGQVTEWRSAWCDTFKITSDQQSLDYDASPRNAVCSTACTLQASMLVTPQRMCTHLVVDVHSCRCFINQHYVDLKEFSLPACSPALTRRFAVINADVHSSALDTVACQHLIARDARHILKPPYEDTSSLSAEPQRRICTAEDLLLKTAHGTASGLSFISAVGPVIPIPVRSLCHLVCIEVVTPTSSATSSASLLFGHSGNNQAFPAESVVS